jgi:hypothetical protein
VHALLEMLTLLILATTGTAMLFAGVAYAAVVAERRALLRRISGRPADHPRAPAGWPRRR